MGYLGKLIKRIIFLLIVVPCCFTTMMIVMLMCIVAGWGWIITGKWYLEDWIVDFPPDWLLPFGLLK